VRLPERATAPLIAVTVLLGAPATASGVAPFGHPCTLQDAGVRFCPTTSNAQRVHSFDGVPLDVDVTLPPTGNGPFPTIEMLHGFPGTKASFELTTHGPAAGVLFHYNNVYYARHGYAVVNYSARGFGNSCGVESSRTSPGCDKGWFHLADQRFELRDAQFLLGKLVDQGVTDPKRIGVTGVSYGGGSSLQLAFLRNRIRKRDGSFARWRSPAGRRLSVAAAYPRWGWSDLAYSLVPNGRFLDFQTSSEGQSADPVGVAKESIVNALYLGGVLVGYLAPKGSDPTADLATWKEKLFAGEPYGKAERSIVDQLTKFKSATGIPGKPAPLLIMDGWTDPAFSAAEALRTYARLDAGRSSYVALQLGDLGHFRAGNAEAMYETFGNQATAFFSRFLKRKPVGQPSGSVTVYGQGCPKGTLGPGPFRLASYRQLAFGRIVVGTRRLHTLTAGGGDDATGKFFDPVANGDPCSRADATPAPRTEVVKHTSPGFTLAGLTTVKAHVSNPTSSYGQLDARLFDLANGKERLIDYGTYRVLPRQDGRVVFQLAGNVYRFLRGHVVKLELLGRNEPWFLRDSTFRLRVRDLSVEVPTR
jgi:fermentation-respiration switch protein FrsA (DUF1100 family)